MSRAVPDGRRGLDYYTYPGLSADNILDTATRQPQGVARMLLASVGRMFERQYGRGKAGRIMRRGRRRFGSDRWRRVLLKRYIRMRRGGGSSIKRRPMATVKPANDTAEFSLAVNRARHEAAHFGPGAVRHHTPTGIGVDRGRVQEARPMIVVDDGSALAPGSLAEQPVTEGVGDGRVRRGRQTGRR